MNATRASSLALAAAALYIYFQPFPFSPYSCLSGSILSGLDAVAMCYGRPNSAITLVPTVVAIALLIAATYAWRATRRS